MSITDTQARPATEPWSVAFAIVLTLSAVYLAFPESVAADVSAGVVAVLSVAALMWGPRHHNVRDTRPWTLLAGAVIAAGVSVAARPATADALTGPSHSAPEGVAAVVSNVLVLLAAGLFVRSAWRGHRAVYVALDASMISVSVASLYISVLLVPALAAEQSAWHRVTSAMYPLVDIGFILCLVALLFTTAFTITAFRWVVAALTCRLIGDFAHAFLASQGDQTMPAGFDVPIILTAGLIGVAALHPSAATFADIHLRETQPWDRPRILLLAAAVTLPGISIMLPHGYHLGAMIARAVGAVSVGLFLLGRAVAAVNVQARIRADLEHTTTHDSLTRLGNRSLIHGRVTRMLHRGNPDTTVSLLLIDVDGFRAVNDTYSHTGGDELLFQVGRRLERVTGEIVERGATIARVGGDEFAIAIRDDMGGALGEKLAAEIVSASRPTVRLSVGNVSGAVSVGVANSHQVVHPSFESLARAADNALEETRMLGAGWTRYNGLDDAGNVPLGMESALRDAIECDQLLVEYQPVIRLADHECISGEAILRWDHPQFGAVPSDTILTLCDEFGLAGKLVHHILDQVAAEMARCPDLPVAVPLPGRMLHSETLPTQVVAALNHHQVNPSRLWIMVPEGALASPLPVVSSVIHGIRAIGVGMSLVDFGEGPGTLDALRVAPVDSLRLGRRMVDRIGRSGAERVVRAAVAVADTFEMHLVAAGVETPTQQETLARCGVGYATGPLMGWPRPHLEDVHQRGR